MSRYQYTTIDSKGNLSTGTTTAANRENALKNLNEENQKVVSLREIDSQKQWWNTSLTTGLSQKDIILITKRIGNMTGHGFSIMDSLRSIELQAQRPALKEVIEDLRNKVELGNSLSDALSDYPKEFSSAYISIVRVGEESGRLSEVMNYLEKQETQLYDLKKKAMTAMIYPLVIIVIMILIATGMVLFLIPFLKDIFSSFHAQLPLPTRILMESEPFLRKYWLAILGGLIILYSLFHKLYQNIGFRKLLDKGLIKLPFVGNLVKTYNVAQIVRTFATLNQSGVPMGQALEILVTVPNNLIYKTALQNVEREVNKGEIFSDSLKKFQNIFPPLVIESIKLGEKTGNLNDSSNYLAELYEDDLKNTLQTLTTLIQPLMLVLVGSMVAIFAISIIMPLQRLPQIIQQSR